MQTTKCTYRRNQEIESWRFIKQLRGDKKKYNNTNQYQSMEKLFRRTSEEPRRIKKWRSPIRVELMEVKKYVNS